MKPNYQLRGVTALFMRAATEGPVTLRTTTPQEASALLKDLEAWHARLLKAGQRHPLVALVEFSHADTHDPDKPFGVVVQVPTSTLLAEALEDAGIRVEESPAPPPKPTPTRRGPPK